MVTNLQVRGSRLKDTVDVTALKPCVLTLIEGKKFKIEKCLIRHRFTQYNIKRCVNGFSIFLLKRTKEDYDEERAVAHVRRVLDIVSSTTCFGPSGAAKDGSKYDSGKNAQDNQGAKKAKSNKDKQSPPPQSPPSKSSKSSSSDDMAVDGDGELRHSCPKLGSFYEFFSLSHLTPPLQCNILSSCI